MFSLIFIQLIYTEETEVSLQSDFTNCEVYQYQWSRAKLQNFFFFNLETFSPAW